MILQNVIYNSNLCVTSNKNMFMGYSKYKNNFYKRTIGVDNIVLY